MAADRKGIIYGLQWPTEQREPEANPQTITCEIIQPFPWLSKFVVLANHDFEIAWDLRILVFEQAMRDHLYVLSGHSDKSWLVGVNREGRLFFQWGDNQRWINEADSLVSRRRVDDGRRHSVRLRRQGSRLSFELDGQLDASCQLPADACLAGDSLHTGGLHTFENAGVMEIIPRLLRVESAYASDSFRSRIRLFTAFYGHGYGRMLTETLLPSLAKSLGSLLTTADVVHRIYCGTEELDWVRTAARFWEAHGVRVDVDTGVVDWLKRERSDELEQSMVCPLLFEVQHSAREDALLVMAQPDHIFGSGLDRVVADMQPGDYVVAGHPRVALESSQEYWRQRFCEPDRAWSNRELVATIIQRFPHPMVRHGLSNPCNYWRGTVCQDEVVVFMKEPPPVCFHATGDIPNVILGETVYRRFAALDHDLIDYMYATGRLRVIQDSDEFFWGELTPEAKYNPTIVNAYWSAAARRLAETELRWLMDASTPQPR